jgi:hypothetical protein
MANTVFDRETLLDLLVNGIPLFILLFFLGVFIALPVFGFGGIEAGLQFGVVVASFVALAILTYLVGKAISLAEKNGTVYMPGQATVEGSKPLEEREEELAGSGEEAAGKLTEDEEADQESEEGAEDAEEPEEAEAFEEPDEEPEEEPAGGADAKADQEADEET